MKPELFARVQRHVSWAVFLVFLGLYAATLLPDVLPADSGEFQWVAATGGVAHPPGYPLYTMLGWLFSRLPLGPTPAWRLNAFSAFTAAVTVALVFSSTRELTDSILGGLVAALTLGSATTFWATATKASIRPLTGFFAALCLYALVRHASQVQHGERPARDRYLVLFFLALSLGLTHHPSLVFSGAVFVLYLILIDPTLLRRPGRWFKPLAALLPGLLVLLYLPLRGAPDLATLSGFLDHVLARGFRGDMFALGLFERLVLLPTLLRFQFNGALLVGMLLGAWLLLWQDRKLAVLLIGSFLVHTMVTLTYDAPQTVEYAMPAYVSLAFLTAVPVGRLLALRSRISVSAPQPVGHGSTGNRERSFPSVIRCAVGVTLLMAGFLNLLAHLPSYRGLSRRHDTRSYVETVLHEAPQGAVILANWHWFTPLRYVQQIEGVRPDVAVEYVAPRGEPLAQTWVHSIEDHISERAVVVVRAFEPEYRALPYTFEPLGEAFLVRSEPRSDAPSGMTALDVVLGAQIEVLGYRLAYEEIRPAQPLTVMLAWSPSPATSQSTPMSEIALFAQLIGPDGDLWSAAEDPRHRLDRLSTEEIVVDRFVVYPHLHAPPGDYTLVLGAYSPEGRLTTPDGSDAIAVETVHLRPSATRPVTQHPRSARLVDGPTLFGVDYDLGMDESVRVFLHWAGPSELTSVQLLDDEGAAVGVSEVPALKRGQYASLAVDCPRVPSRLIALGDVGSRRWHLILGRSIRLPSPPPGARYVPFGDAMVLTRFDGPAGGLERGTDVPLHLHFSGQRPLERDYIVSTSLTGLNEDGSWAWREGHDTVPALGAVPTLKWIRGSSLLDPHRVSVPEDVPSGPVVGSLLIYDHFTQRSLPHLDERYGPAVELDSWRVSR